MIVFKSVTPSAGARRVKGWEFTFPGGATLCARALYITLPFNIASKSVQYGIFCTWAGASTVALLATNCALVYPSPVKGFSEGE